MSEQQAAEELVERLREAVRIRLVAEVPWARSSQAAWIPAPWWP
jgi:hypothetical protein